MTRLPTIEASEVSSASKMASTLTRPSMWVLIVAAVYGSAQFIVLDLDLFLGWDEAVYVSEVSRFTDAVSFAAHRARGITLIVAPVAQLTDSMVALRSYLVVVSSAALFVSFVVWCRIIGWAAPLAAALFASSWMTLFFGSQVTPNIYSAFLAVAAVGIGLRYSRSFSRVELWGVIALSASAALIRPLDGLTLVAGLALIGFVTNRRSIFRLALAGVAGFGLGVLPWIIEAWIRFGGPFERLQRARELVGGGVTNNLTEYVHLLDGPLVWSDGADEISRWAVIWLCLLLALGVLGAVVGARRRREAGRVLMLCSALSALPYLVGADVAAPRFMLPALALLCIASGNGLSSLLALTKVREFAAVGVAALFVLSIGWNLPVFLSTMTAHIASGERVLVLGEALRERSPQGHCRFFSPSGHPQIAVASGCRGSRLTPDMTHDAGPIADAAASGLDVFVWARQDWAPNVVGDAWQCESVENLPPTDWLLCFP